MKYINYLLLVTLLFIAFLFKDSIHISTNVLSLFAPKESLSRLKIANELGYSKEMFVAIKGFNKESKNSLKAMSKEFEALNEIKRVTYSLKPSKEIEQYYKDYYAVLANFSTEKLSKEEIRGRLQTLYNGALNSFLYTPINKNDPLALFSMPKSKTESHKGKYLTLGTYGYLLKITTNIEPSQMDKAKLLYEKVQNILQKYPNSVAFAPFFYSVENSAKIKGDVKYIVALSTIILLLIYIVMLRDIKLLSHTFVALVSSMLFATLICTTTIENFGVLSLAFGTSLSAVSIDYFFHYYFHSFYVEKKGFDKSVFYGYLTTAIAFGIFTFIPVAMISQISLFALLSLSYAYLVFTFVFKYLEIQEPKREIKNSQSRVKIPALFVTLMSLGLFAFSYMNITFDSNIRNLDYQNAALQKAQELFKNSSSKQLSPVIVEAKNKQQLLQRLHKLKTQQSDSFSFANFVMPSKLCQERKNEINSYDIKSLKTQINTQANKIGFKENYFEDAYDFTKNIASCEDVNLSIFNSLGLELYTKNEKLYTIAMVENINRATALQGVSAIDVKSLFAKVAKGMLENIILYAAVVLVAIFALLLLSVRTRFFYALNYIIFPLSFSLATISLFYELNIMHLFSLIILIAIGIDYGIYMSNTHKQANTMLAIKYSLLSTFAAFGVLLFSSISALYSIGLVISLGVSSIFILTKVMR